MKKQFLLGLGMAAMLMSASCAKEFSDVSKDYWANDIITKMSDKGIINGYEDGTFRPDNILTRAEFATIMTKVLKLNEKVYLESSFADVKTEDWEHNFAEAVKDYLVTYERDGKKYFDSYEPAVREDVIVALVKALKWNTEDLKNKAEDIFSDADKIGEGLDKFIVSAYENGLVKGYEDKTVNPKGSLTRAEAMALVNVLLNGESEEEKADYLFKINGVEYSKDEFETYYKVQGVTLKQYLGDTEEAKEYIKAMTQSVFVELNFIAQKAKELGITLTDSDKAAIEKELTNTTVVELLKDNNITDSQYREMLEDAYLQLRVQKLLEAEAVSQVEWDRFFADKPEELYKYNIRHILFMTVDENTGEAKSAEEVAQAEAKANEVLARLKAGEDFAALAGEFTEDPGSKTTGGLYENVTVGQMVTEFNDTMIALQPGQLYDGLVKTSYGYHIMKLDNKVQLTAEEIEAIKVQRVSSLVQETMSTWFKDVKVETNEELFKSIK